MDVLFLSYLHVGYELTWLTLFLFRTKSRSNPLELKVGIMQLELNADNAVAR
jgi:hypothetical protein